MCLLCHKQRCPRCTKAEGVPAAADPTEHQHCEAVYSDALLNALEELPQAYRLPAVLWVPRSLRPQVAALLRQQLARATSACARPYTDTEARIDVLLLLHLPQLVLRPPGVVPPDASIDDNIASVVSVLRPRARAAREGKWLELVQELIDEFAKRSPSSSPQPPQGADDAELSPALAQAVASRARTGALRSAAAMLTGQPAVPPGPTTDAAVRALFHTSPRPEPEDVRLSAAAAAARSSPRRLKVTLRHVATQLRATRAAAGHGPSGWRNSHILLLASDPEGTTALARWAQCWASAQIAPWAAELLTPAIARPFYKDAHRAKNRPVLCAEALYKFALGLVVRATASATAAVCGPRQYALQSGGAIREVLEVRAAARAWPDRPLIALDVKNAFGALGWANTLEAAALVPALAATMGAAWASGRVRIWTAAPDGGWTSTWTTGSVIQGNPEGSPLYCLTAAKVDRELRQREDMQPHLASLHDWAYVDDWVLQPAAEGADPILTALREVCDHNGLQLQESKCSFHIPACATDNRPLPVSLVRFADRVPHSRESLTLLGSVAGGAYTTPLHVPTTTPQSTQECLSRALHLCRRAMQLVDAAPPAGGRQPAFALARVVAAHALDYDSGVLPSALVAPHARVLDDAVRAAVFHSADILPSEVTDTVLKQVALPRRLGGLQVTAAATTVPCARAAALLAHGQHVRDAASAWSADPDGEDLPAPEVLDGIDSEAAEVLSALRDMGIASIAGTGRPAPEGHGCSTPLRSLNPDAHLLSHFLKFADDVAHSRLLASLCPDACARLLSAGGPSAGTSLTAPLSQDGVHFADWQWVEAIRYRLGIPCRAPGSLCKNERADGVACGCQLDANGDHATDCEFGPLRNRRHDDLADVYADIVDECGGIARREAFIPELSRGREAWLDVWAYGTPELPDLLLDISVRNPTAQRYRAIAGSSPGAAAAAGEREKFDRYPPAGGRTVWPVVYETRGRAGAEAERLLQQLAAAFRRRAHRRGRATGQELARWSPA